MTTGNVPDRSRLSPCETVEVQSILVAPSVRYSSYLRHTRADSVGSRGGTVEDCKQLGNLGLQVCGRAVDISAGIDYHTVYMAFSAHGMLCAVFSCPSYP